MKRAYLLLLVSLCLSAIASTQSLIISEFRVRGPNGANDEYIEIYNNSNADHTVAGGGTGYALAASNGVARFIIPNGTVIPARGHYLGVNSVGYSLASYPAGNGTTATGDATYTTDIPDNAGIALFNTSVAVDFVLANRLDAVGSTSEANSLYKEGTGYPAIVPFSVDYCFHRRQISGLPVDINNNAADFKFEDTNGTSAGAGQSLGAPGPENLSSPVNFPGGIVVTVADVTVPTGNPPNTIRDFTSDPPNNSTFGTLDMRFKVVNNTGAPVTRLRLRVTDITTFPSPSGIADLRPRTSAPIVVPVTGYGNVTVQGTTLEQPPSQPNGGGINSSMGVNIVTLATPIAPGATEFIRVLTGIQQTGTIRAYFVLEALPLGSGGNGGSGAGVSVPFGFKGQTDGVRIFGSPAACDISSASLTNVSACNDNGTPGDPADDFFTADLNVNFTNPPATGTLRIEPGNPNVLDVVEIPVGSLIGNTHTFTGVRLRTTGAIYAVEVEFSDDAVSCVRTIVAPAVASCSALPCDISSATLTNVSTCNNNGTPGDPSDDFYTADLNVTFANPPATGTLRIEPGNPNVLDVVEIPVGSLVGNTHTFTAVRLRATGAVYAVEVEFSADNACVRTVAAPAVNPAPQVDAVANQTHCAGSSVPSVVFTSSQAGATFAWSRTAGAIGLVPTNGTGNVPSFTATNAGTTPLTVTFSVVATNGGGCTGAPIQFTMTIMPMPTVNPVPDQTFCHNLPTTPIAFSGSVPGTIFQWTNSNPAIGLGASGTGNIPSFIAQNPGAVPITATITVTPTVNSSFVTNVFSYTGAMQTWVVPAGVTSVSLQAFGARGNSNALGVAGGLGGSASGSLAVAPGNTLYIYVGGGGTSSINGGFNGGGNAGNSTCLNARGGGGGGASDVRLNVNTFAGRVLVAAGGAGAGGNRVSGCGRGTGGGGGGGLYGGGGGAAWPFNSTILPTGGTQSAGGSGGQSDYASAPNNDGLPGVLGIGGKGGDEVSSSQGGSATALSGGGAGGGLIGASGIYGPNWTGQSGAGGSSYIGGVTAGATVGGVRAGNGEVSISYLDPNITPVVCSGTPRTFTITVNPAPTITCPGNIVTNSTPGICGAVVNYSVSAVGPPAPALSYSFSGATIGSGNGSGSGSVFNVGVTTVTVTGTNVCGAVSCSFTITVNDVEPPTIICPANITVPNAAGLCGANVTYPFPSVVDNCPLPPGTAVTLNQSTNTTTIVPIQIGCQAGGLTTPNSWWRAYNLAPLNLPAGITVRSVRFGIERSQFSSGSVVATIRIWRSNGAFPGASRTLLSTQNVTISNQTGTFLTVPLSTPASFTPTQVAVVELALPEGRFAPNQGAFFIGSNDLGESGPSYLSAAACGAPNPTPLADLVAITDHIHLAMNAEYYTSAPTLVQLAPVLPSGSFFPVGTTTLNWQATDASGNTATCSFTITVNDVQPPSITCPANQIRNTDAGQCYATFTPPQPTFADNCLVTKLTWVMTGATTGSSPATGINYVPSTQFLLTGTTGVGITTITYTAADAAGNTTSCSFTVRVNDASIPVISTQPATKFVCVGSDGVFTVIASAGAGNPLTYQWQQWNGATWVNIAGATASTLTIPAVSFAQNTNTYRCVLTGRCSVVISSTATLYVNPLPTVSVVTSIPPALLPGQSLNIISTVNPVGGTYAWYKNNVVINSPLAQGPVLSNLTVNDIGTYKLVYTDLNGCVNTSSDVVITGLASENLWVYPVPNDGRFQVRYFNQVGEQATIRIFDAKGAKVYERSAVTNTAYTRIDVELSSATADGVYVVELVNAAGKRVGAKKIIVRRKL